VGEAIGRRSNRRDLLRLRERSLGAVEPLKDWMARNNGPVLSVRFLIIGVKLNGDALAGPST
jgi:hypothetical protein